MPRVPRLALLLSFLPLAAAAQRPAPFPARGTWYRVEIPAHDRRLVQVEARIALNDSILIMSPDGARHLAEGWSTYLRGLRATDDAGRPIRLRRAGRDRWAVPRPFPSAVRLRYEVLLHHDAGDWPFGSKEAAYATDDAVFVTGKALFIAQRALRPTRVRVDLPPGWRLATPWTPVDGQAGTYHVPNVAELLAVGMLAGRHEQHRLVFGETTVTLAVGQSLPGALEALRAAMVPALRETSRLFGGAPAGRLVAIANAAGYDGGAAFTRSFTVVYSAPPSAENRAAWAPILAHELLHLWLGDAINTPDGVQENWFLEGTTDYVATLVALRSGFITRDEFYARLGQHWDRYRAAAGRLSLHRAGEDKIRNYDLIYSGGLLAGFVLDVSLRRATAGREGIDGVLRRLWSAHGRTGAPMRRADLRAAIRATAGEELEWLFARHIDGTQPLPLSDALAPLGHVLHPGADAATPSRIEAADMTPEQRMFERALLGGA